MPGARSNIYRYYYVSEHPTNPTKNSDANTNGPILMECKTLRYVVGSKAEAETGGIFINVHNIVPTQ